MPMTRPLMRGAAGTPSRRRGPEHTVQPLDPVQDVPGTGALERLSGKGPPKGGNRRDSGGVAGRDVVRRVADKVRALGFRPELL